MKYPNVRYGNPNEFRHYAQGMPLKDLAKRLRRSERCIMNWMKERERIPYWVPELLRLQDMEHGEMMRQMGIYKLPARLGTVTETGIIYEIPKAPSQTPSNTADTLNQHSPEHYFG
jgi:hypothetical protein